MTDLEDKKSVDLEERRKTGKQKTTGEPSGGSRPPVGESSPIVWHSCCFECDKPVSCAILYKNFDKSDYFSFRNVSNYLE